VVQLQLANLSYALQRWKPALGYFKLAIKGYIASGRPADSDAVIEISIKIADCFGRLDQSTEALAGFSWCVDVARHKVDALPADTATEDRRNSAMTSTSCWPAFLRSLTPTAGAAVPEAICSVLLDAPVLIGVPSAGITGVSKLG